METVFHYDVVVVGAGHAGCEAASAAARMGAKTCLVTMDMNKIAQMSCNPAVGGIAKGQIVREIDALGGQMGEVTDATAIQFRMLNRSKGPAMWSPRAQCDRARFITEWRHRLENTPNLNIWQDEVTEVIAEQGVVKGVRTIWGATLMARAVVITAGTFLRGLMHIGRKQVSGGRCAEPAAAFLTESINSLGIRSARMKTGTPVRIDKRSVHLDEMTVQPGETDYHRFSYISPMRPLPQMIEKYPPEPKLDMEYLGRKLPRLPQGQERTPIHVPHYFIDTNQHVNNAKYILIGEECLPENFKVHRIWAEYRRPAVLGDVICPHVTVEPSCTAVGLCNEDGAAYANLLFYEKAGARVSMQRTTE